MAPLHDIAVVGYGPTGLTAASLLGRLGHRVVVCERWPTPYGLPRLTHIDDETARTIQAAADVDEALRDSSPCEYLRVNGKGETLVRIPASADGPMGYPGQRGRRPGRRAAPARPSGMPAPPTGSPTTWPPAARARPSES